MGINTEANRVYNAHNRPCAAGSYGRKKGDE
jgi:hypothetical protein